MSTFIEVQNRINQDFLNRNFGDETKRAIKAAIRHYERQRMYFNETATALAASAGDMFVLLPSNFLVIDDLRITINSEDLKLRPQEPGYIRQMNLTGVQGQPTDYAFSQNKIMLAIVPDQSYSLPFYYIKNLPELVADSDENYWLQGSLQDVIAYNAAKLMWATVLRNDKEALKFKMLEDDAWQTTMGLVEQRRVPGRLKATQF